LRIIFIVGYGGIALNVGFSCCSRVRVRLFDLKTAVLLPVLVLKKVLFGVRLSELAVPKIRAEKCRKNNLFVWLKTTAETTQKTYRKNA